MKAVLRIRIASFWKVGSGSAFSQKTIAVEADIASIEAHPGAVED
jgi:hypothetical protein